MYLQSREGVHPLALELTRLVDPFDQVIHARIVASGHPTCELAEAPLKEKLKKIEGELAEARDQRVELATARDDARTAFAGSESLSQDSDEFKTAENAVRELGACDDRIADLQAVQVATLRMLGKDPASANGRGQDRAAGNPEDPRASWDARAMLAGEDMRATLETFANSSARMGRVEIGEAISRDALAADITGTTAMRRGDWAGIMPQLRRQLRVLDLLPTGAMDSNTFPYTQEGGAFTGAVEVAEGAAKSEGAATFTDAEATARTIAAWLKLQKQSLSDTPALQAIIENRLRYMVERRLEAQILAGDGTPPNLQGILGTSGIGAVAFDADELAADQVLRGITTVLLADAQATGIVMNPLDWQDAILAKASGDGHYYSGGPFQVTPQVMWGLPLIPSASIPQGMSLVADWEIGAMLLIREGVHVLLSDSDQDDFTKNKVTLLGEMRAALPVFRPAAFCTVDLAA